MKLNLNIPCKITLTARGASAWNAQYDDVPEEYRPDVCNAGDKIKTQLWNVMQVFGPYIHIGMGQVHFEDNNIEIDDYDAVQGH